MVHIQDIFKYMDIEGKIDYSKLNHKQKKALRNIIECKTEVMGFNTDTCECCGHTEIHYNSCKNPNCPECGAVDKEIWIHKQERFTLNVNYFHVVFTIPSELNVLCLIDPKFMYKALFDISAETIKELSKDKKYLGAKIGFTSVLHTWGQNLSLHPHIHMIVPGGGIDSNGKWKNSKKKFFLPVKVVSKLFKGKFLSYTKKNFDQRKIKDEEQFQNIINTCYSKDWVVYTKKPMKSAKHVVKYLGRYTHRIAISNARIKKYEDNKVTFSYKDYSDHNQIKEMTLDDTEFFRRYMMHVLPPNFMKIRHYGFLGNRNKEERIKAVRTATNTKNPGPLLIDYEQIISDILKRDVSICIKCGQKRHYQLE